MNTPRFAEQLRGLLQVALMTTLQYRSNFLISFFIGACESLGVALPVVFVYQHGASLGGWTIAQCSLVVSFFLLMSGVIGAFVEPNLGAIVEGVRKGTLDFVLLKPVDAQLLGTVQRVDPTRLWSVVGGLGVGGWALWGARPAIHQVLSALVLFVAGLSAMYSLWLLVICLSFWFVRVDNLRYLLSSISDAGRWPIVVYKGWVRSLLTVVIPVALVTSYPAVALTTGLESHLWLLSLAVALVALTISRKAWKFALSHYTSASS